jgi:hypothetical protein
MDEIEVEIVEILPDKVVMKVGELLNKGNMKQNSVNVDIVKAMTDYQLVNAAWTLLTNNRQCGGGTVKGRALAQRRLRRMGFKFYLGRDGNGNIWGMVAMNETIPVGIDHIEIGVTLNHCAHKLGKGDATKGWKFVWS